MQLLGGRGQAENFGMRASPLPVLPDKTLLVVQYTHASCLLHIPGVTTVCPHLMAADWKM